MICIICKKTFEGDPPEHFIPKHMGGKDTIDCVCKKCNNGYLAKIDGRIRSNLQLSMAIDSTSRPRYEEVHYPGGILQRKVTILNGRTNKLKSSNQTPNGPITPIGYKFTIKPEEDLLLHKVFVKLFFETVAFKFGAHEAIKSKYDLFRTYLTSESEEIPQGLSITRVAVTVSKNRITELVSFDSSSNQVTSNVFKVDTIPDPRKSNIILADNRNNECDALVILLGGKKSGKVSFSNTIPERFIYIC